MEGEEGIDYGFYQNILSQARSARFDYAWFNENEEGLLFNTRTGNTENDIPSFLMDESSND